MNVDDVRQIAAWLEAAGLDGFELTTPAAQLRLTLGGRAAVTAEPLPAQPAPKPAGIAARGTGEFLAAHPYADAPLVQPGQRVRAGDIAALLRCGTLIQPVTASEDGVVGALLATPGTVVGFGTALMHFTPEGRTMP
jgi:biotin carboxyl carrier protein